MHWTGPLPSARSHGSFGFLEPRRNRGSVLVPKIALWVQGEFLAASPTAERVSPSCVVKSTAVWLDYVDAHPTDRIHGFTER
jgi:hypothetical protein